MSIVGRFMQALSCFGLHSGRNYLQFWLGSLLSTLTSVHMCFWKFINASFWKRWMGFFAYQEVIEHDMENLCEMDINPSILII